jgi:hypothetical protein
MLSHYSYLRFLMLSIISRRGSVGFSHVSPAYTASDTLYFVLFHQSSPSSYIRHGVSLCTANDNHRPYNFDAMLMTVAGLQRTQVIQWGRMVVYL